MKKIATIACVYGIGIFLTYFHSIARGAYSPPILFPLPKVMNYEGKIDLVSSHTDAFPIDFIPSSLEYIIISETPVPTPSFTPTPTPTAPVVFMAGSDFDRWISIYGDKYGVDKELLKRIAKCESRLNPNARTSLYGGLFQFSLSTWVAVRGRMNENPDPNLRYDPLESIKTAAYKISKEGTGAWPVCGKR